MAAPVAAEPPQPSADEVGVYRPRRPRASSFYRLLERHFRELGLVWDERFASAFGPWRGVIPPLVSPAGPGAHPTAPGGADHACRGRALTTRDPARTFARVKEIPIRHVNVARLA